MITLKVRSRLLTGLALAAALAAPSAPAATAEVRHARYVVGLSPFLAHEAKDQAYRLIVRFLLEDMPLDSSLWIYDAYHVRTVTQVTVPALVPFQSSRTRANQFKDRIHELKRFLAATHPKPAAPEFDFDQAVRFPQFMDFVSENLLASAHSLTVVILGGPLYLDDKEPSFSMVRGYFPSDGHLWATRDKSVFGANDRANSLQGVAVHFGYFGEPWESELHQEKISRFWTLFLKRQGARLATFSGDLPTVFNALRGGAEASDARERRHEIDTAHTKVEMLRITREVGLTDWITRDLPANPRLSPPSITKGPMKIGIRWQGDLDVDLYARPTRQGETLYFQQTRSPEGYYYKDHRSSPDREYEFIEFLTGVDIWQTEAFVNFYEGNCPGGITGEVRIEFDGKIYSDRFSIPSPGGNRGRAGNSQSEFWTTLDIPAILKLRSATAPDQ